MKILLISSGTLPVPCVGYGGLEMIVADLAIELDKAGHDVSVVAPSESGIGKFGKIQLIDCGPCDANAHAWEERAFHKYKDMLTQYDVIHDHSWGKWAYFAKNTQPKLNVCSTLHGMLCYHTPPPVSKPSMIGISKRHADLISAGLGIPVRCVYNGIDLDKYKMGESKRNDRFLFLARITPFKGTHVFVDAMKQLGAKGDVVGDDQLVEDKGYVDRILMECSGNNNLRYWGGVPRDRAVEFFRTAKAYVLPCTPGWEEPFGLTIVEAQACGCPVISTASGAIPELIIEGETGYVAKSLQDIPALLSDEKIKAIDPKKCRENAEKFSRKAMADNYQKLYKELVEKGGW